MGADRFFHPTDPRYSAPVHMDVYQGNTMDLVKPVSGDSERVWITNPIRRYAHGNGQSPYPMTRETVFVSALCTQYLLFKSTGCFNGLE